MDIKFLERLSKGVISETFCRIMLRDKYTILPFGYEYITPELVQYRKQLVHGVEMAKQISTSPDFILISPDKTQIMVVDVKFNKDLDFHRLKSRAKETVKVWKDCYYFIATPQGFYFDTCENVIRNPTIKLLSTELVDKETQEQCQQLLCKFIQT